MVPSEDDTARERWGEFSSLASGFVSHAQACMRLVARGVAQQGLPGEAEDQETAEASLVTLAAVPLQALRVSICLLCIAAPGCNWSLVWASSGLLACTRKLLLRDTNRKVLSRTSTCQGQQGFRQSCLLFSTVCGDLTHFLTVAKTPERSKSCTVSVQSTRKHQQIYACTE